MRVLYVCTANVCRSPAAEAIHRSRRPDDEVDSAGVLADGVMVADARMREPLRRRGVELGPRTSRPLTTTELAWADLVITMTAAHALDVVAIDEQRAERVVTLGELTALLADGLPLDPGALAGRRGAPALVDRRGDDVDDPYGRSRRTYRRVIDRLLTDVTAVAEAPRA